MGCGKSTPVNNPGKKSGKKKSSRKQSIELLQNVPTRVRRLCSIQEIGYIIKFDVLGGNPSLTGPRNLNYYTIWNAGPLQYEGEDGGNCSTGCIRGRWSTVWSDSFPTLSECQKKKSKISIPHMVHRNESKPAQNHTSDKRVNCNKSPGSNLPARSLADSRPLQGYLEHLHSERSSSKGRQTMGRRHSSVFLVHRAPIKDEEAKKNIFFQDIYNNTKFVRCGTAMVEMYGEMVAAGRWIERFDFLLYGQHFNLVMFIH